MYALYPFTLAVAETSGVVPHDHSRNKDDASYYKERGVNMWTQR
jgi:hypothetical protein